MNLLTISSLFPNNIDYKHGVFVETRLRQLVKAYPDIKPVVIAPVPWFPFTSKRFGEYAKFAGVKSVETRHGVEIHHPRYIVIPKIGMYITPWFMYRAMKRTLKKLMQQGYQFDLIDGHYFYPDGVAIAKLAREFDIPFTCTARGTDINLIPAYPKARKMIEKVFKQASHLMAVCQALSDEMINMGADAQKVTTLRNGVDLDAFPYANEAQQAEFKQQIGVSGRLVLSVGWLIERKGHYLIIEAMANMADDVTLLIAGDGPDKDALEKQIEQMGLSSRVRLLGALPHHELRDYYRAADALILASSREGWANVLLESMASGTPVVATKVWGSPEVVNTPAAGYLCERSAQDIAKVTQTLLDNPPMRADTRAHAEKFSWEATSAGQANLFENIQKK